MANRHKVDSLTFSLNELTTIEEQRRQAAEEAVTEEARIKAAEAEKAARQEAEAIEAAEQRRQAWEAEVAARAQAAKEAALEEAREIRARAAAIFLPLDPILPPPAPPATAIWPWALAIGAIVGILSGAAAITVVALQDELTVARHDAASERARADAAEARAGTLRAAETALRAHIEQLEAERVGWPAVPQKAPAQRRAVPPPVKPQKAAARCAAGDPMCGL